jgi:hypothetical protein
VARRDGVFDRAIEMMREGRRLGYRLCTNTTVYRDTDIGELEELMRLVSSLSIEGMLISPGYHYERIDGDHFLYRAEIHEKFRRVRELAGRYRIDSTPLFLEFAAGLRDYPCTPWGNPTRTPHGWKGPCYLIEERLYPTWKEFWNGVDWDYWEKRVDPRCHDCMMHSGFEPSVVRHLGNSMRDLATMTRWQFDARPRPVRPVPGGCDLPESLSESGLSAREGESGRERPDEFDGSVSDVESADVADDAPIQAGVRAGERSLDDSPVASSSDVRG